MNANEVAGVLCFVNGTDQEEPMSGDGFIEVTATHCRRFTIKVFEPVNETLKRWRRAKMKNELANRSVGRVYEAKTDFPEVD